MTGPRPSDAVTPHTRGSRAERLGSYAAGGTAKEFAETADFDERGGFRSAKGLAGDRGLMRAGLPDLRPRTSYAKCAHYADCACVRGLRAAPAPRPDPPVNKASHRQPRRSRTRFCRNRAAAPEVDRIIQIIQCVMLS